MRIQTYATGLLALLLAAGMSACSYHKKAEENRAIGSLQLSGYPTDYLIDARTLNSWLTGGKDVDILQVSSQEAYLKAHIPGARQIYRPDFQVDNEGYYGMMAPKATLEALLGKLGLSEGKTLVIYDEHGNVNAARLWWVLRFYGYENMVMVDGGLSAWLASGYTTVSDVPEPPHPTLFRFTGKQDSKLLATKHNVLEALSDPEVVIIDTRSRDEFTGHLLKKGASRPGRIPGSISIDYIAALNAQPGGDHTFKSVEELKAIYRTDEIGTDNRIITYCHSGVRSALTTFVLTELLGFKNVQNYDGSWVEWSYFKELPVESDSASSI